MRQSKAQLMEKFTYLYWLRPESVLLGVGRACPLQKYYIEPPFLDIGCGDGLFSFLAGGGTIAKEFDPFLFINPKGFYDNKDIHENYEEDIYRVPIENYPPSSVEFIMWGRLERCYVKKM